MLWGLFALMFTAPQVAQAEPFDPAPVGQHPPVATPGLGLPTFAGLTAARKTAAAGDRGCAEWRAGSPRLVIVAGQPTPMEIETCRQTAAAAVLAMTIGYQAIVFVTPASASAFAIHLPELFRALAQHAGDQPAPANWSDVDPSLPNLSVGFLAPPVGSVASRLLSTYVMEPACSQLPDASVPFERASRLEYCGAVRNGPGIVRRPDTPTSLDDWAASASGGQLAAVNLAELRHLGRSVVALPLDDVLPTEANIEAGRYQAAEPVTVLIVMPHDNRSATPEATRQAAFERLSERVIGPAGSLALGGMIPLPPEDRVAVRSRAIGFLENP